MVTNRAVNGYPGTRMLAGNDTTWVLNIRQNHIKIGWVLERDSTQVSAR